MKAHRKARAPIKRPVLYKGLHKRPIEYENGQSTDTQEPSSKRTKTTAANATPTTRYIEQKKKKLDIRYDSANVPADYQLVQYGNKEVIQYLLERSRKKGVAVWIANSHGQTQQKADMPNDPMTLASHVGRVGYHFHKDLVRRALKQFNVTLQKGKLSNTSQGPKKKVTKADHEKGLAELYPRMPDRDRQTVIRSLSTKATKIGKATGTMNMYKQIELAVIAHVRHSHTDYEKLIYMSGKAAARTAVEPDIAAKLAEWKGEDGQHVDEDETELVEQEEAMSSTEESSEASPEDDESDYEPPPAQELIVTPPNLLSPHNISKPWAYNPEDSYPSSEEERRRPPPFGSRRYDDYQFSFDPPPPQRHAPVPYRRNTPPPPAHAPFHIPVTHPRDSPQRIHLRPLPPSPIYHDHRGYALPLPPPPPQRRYDLREPPPRFEYEQRIQYRPLPPAPPPHHMSPPRFDHHPGLRFRPLSPELILQSREQY